MNKKLRNQLYYGSAIFAILWVTYSICYVSRNGWTSALTAISAEGSASKSLLGLVSTGFFISYGAMQIILCLFVDRVDPRKLISFGLVGSAVANLGMALVSDAKWMIGIWFVNGFFQSLVWAPLLAILSSWVPKEQQSRFGVLLSATYPCGTLIAYGVPSFIIPLLGWRYIFVFSVILLLGATGFCLFGLKSLHNKIGLSQTDGVPAKKSNPVPTRKVPFFGIILSSGALIIALAMMSNGIIKEGVTMWIPTYISEKFSVTASVALLITLVLPIVNISGVYIARFVQRRLTHDCTLTCAVLFGYSTLALTILVTSSFRTPVIPVILLSSTTACMLGVNNAYLTFLPMSFAKFGRTASISGFLNSFAYAATAISAYAFGALTENYGWTVTQWAWVGVAGVGALFSALASIPWKKYKNNNGVSEV